MKRCSVCQVKTDWFKHYREAWFLAIGCWLLAIGCWGNLFNHYREAGRSVFGSQYGIPYLFGKGTGYRYISKRLEHKSSNIAGIYAHVSARSGQRIKFPFEDYDI